MRPLPCIEDPYETVVARQLALSRHCSRSALWFPCVSVPVPVAGLVSVSVSGFASEAAAGVKSILFDQISESTLAERQCADELAL